MCVQVQENVALERPQVDLSDGTALNDATIRPKAPVENLTDGCPLKLKVQERQNF